MIKALSQTTILLITAALLAGCGGGSDGSAPPPPANRAPAFSSAATVSVAENATGAVYTAAASDPDNDPLTYSIADGADAARFALSSGGVLSFQAAPDFEAPADADRDNVYRVQLAVSDGRGGQATLDVAVTVTNAAGGAFRVRRAATGFAQPLYLTAFPDNSGRVLVVEQGGRIRLLDPATGAIAATPFLDLTGTISTGGERGLLGLALAPDFTTSGRFFVYLTNQAGNIELRSYRTQAANRAVADPATADLILTFTHPFANHNGGWIEFGPDGFLYIGSGDGGGAGDPQNNGQNTATLLGKLLRIDVASDAFPADPNRDYAIPPSNPFATAGGAPEVYAYGLRNPFRNGFDRVTGNLYLGDVGQNAVEEVDLVPLGQAGLNFGWARLEGTRSFNGTPPANATPPVTEYTRGSGPVQGATVIGGPVYRGPVEALQGLYVFGDFISGNLWTVPATSLVQGQTFAASGFTVRNTDFTPTAGAIDSPSSFGTDQRGNLYIVDYDGEVFVVEPA
ncbi:MAG: PQQ-dependent sugar dehydrogenase [Novosphingobium sp.]